MIEEATAGVEVVVDMAVTGVAAMVVAIIRETIQVATKETGEAQETTMIHTEDTVVEVEVVGIDKTRTVLVGVEAIEVVGTTPVEGTGKVMALVVTDSPTVHTDHSKVTVEVMDPIITEITTKQLEIDQPVNGVLNNSMVHTIKVKPLHNLVGVLVVNGLVITTVEPVVTTLEAIIMAVIQAVVDTVIKDISCCR